MCTPPRGLRGWGCPRRAAGPSVPLSADTVSPRPRLRGWGGGPCLWGGEKGGFELAPRPRASVVGVSPFESFLAPQAAFGWCWPLGCRGCWGWSRAAWRGGGPRGWCGVVWGRVFGPPSFTVLPLAGGASRRPAGPAAPPASAVPSFPAARPRSVPAPRPTPRGSRPVGTGGSRPRPSPWVRPRPGDACPGGDPRDAAASARRCALSPRAVAVPRFEPPLREGAACGGGGGGRG